MKRLVCLFVCMCMIFALASCGTEMKGSYDAPKGEASMEGGDYNGAWDAPMADAEMSPEAPGEVAGDQETPSPETLRPKAGMITAGAHNDNTYYDGWLELFLEDGKFYGYDWDIWHFDSLQRVKVTVKNGGNALAGEKVTLHNDAETVVGRAVTDANGVAYLFAPPQQGGMTVRLGNAVQTLSEDTAEVTFDLTKENQKKNKIELMLVVDVTGSMGDELTFLQKELENVIDRVAFDNANAEIMLSLLFYRDHGDADVFSFHDFTKVNTATAFDKMQKELAKQHADGGGDTPEAVDEALKMAMDASWSKEATTKIIFHVLDAPPHTAKKYGDTYYAAVQSAAEQGIRICPVLCSGADHLTEYLTRQAALYTGGTFVFVTDHSGIGGAHHDPDLPNVTVEYLNDLMVRLVNGYHTGTFKAPVSYTQSK